MFNLFRQVFFMSFFSLISTHVFAQILIKNIIQSDYKIQQKNKILIIDI